MGVHGKQVGSSGVNSGDHQIRSNMTLVSEEMLFEEGHTSDDAGLSTGREGVQLELRRDEGGGKLGIGRGTGTSAPDLG